ncbi:hypothetical protein [Roseiarcus sp.]|uniref:hypothetical protein n=1 Tax=Roseiarcus sp. TaxID=1969460 RepID=UPI003F94FFE7
MSEIVAGVEPAQQNGKAAALTGGLAHDVSIVLGVGRHLGSHPRAKTSMTIMRAPQRGHGERSTRGASGVCRAALKRALLHFVWKWGSRIGNTRLITLRNCWQVS